MAATRKKPVKRAPKPRTPARVKKRRTKTRSHHHPELWGLGMVAVGLFLATVLWLGWDGGAVGAHGRRRARTEPSVVPPTCFRSCSSRVGALMLVRSEIVDLKPFRTGLVVGAFGLMIALGRDQGGAIGGALGGGLAHVLGETGALIVGVALFVAGVLLFTGASAGAVLRRSGTAMRRAGNAARRSFDSEGRRRAGSVPRIRRTSTSRRLAAGPSTRSRATPT